MLESDYFNIQVQTPLSIILFGYKYYFTFYFCFDPFFSFRYIFILFQGYFGTAEGVTQRHSRPRETLPIEYTSPEQLRTKLYANSDVFAIAVITYEMIFGRYLSIYLITVLEINFFLARSKYLLPGIKASSNTHLPGSKS